MTASEVERRFFEWLRSAVVLSPAERIRLVAIVRARLERTQGTASETKIRLLIKRLTDAFVYGGIGEADYREDLQKLRVQLAVAQKAPDERRTLSAIKVAQDFAAAWDRSQPERRKQLLGLMFDAVRIRDGSPVAVRPKPELAPLFAVRVHTGGPDRGWHRQSLATSLLRAWMRWCRTSPSVPNLQSLGRTMGESSQLA